MSSENPIDIHGIKKLYKSSTRSDAPLSFVMGDSNWKDRISQWDGDFVNDGGLNVIFTSTSDDKQRMNVYADPSKPTVPYDANELNRDVLKERPDKDGVKRGGWTAKSNDWRDYEVTSIQFIPVDPDGHDGDDPSDTHAWYGRGAKHTGSSVDEGSQGSAYKPDLWYAGNNQGWQVLKETLHFDQYKASNNQTIRENGSSNVLFNQNLGNIKGRWFGIKTIVFNLPPLPFPDGGRFWPVQIEIWTCNCDTNGVPDNNWIPRFTCQDNPVAYGQWSDLPDDQPGKKNHTISWGGPIITCRTDRESGTGGGYPGMKFQKVSIREIEPNQRL